jgi:flagellar hook-associated protein 3 FlgL
MFSQGAIRQNQTALAKAQQELATQRHSDVPLQLSSQTGRNIRWHSDLKTLDDVILGNDLLQTRSNLVQASLQTVSTLASDFLKNLVSSRALPGGKDIIQKQSTNALSMMQDALNVESNGSFLFAGRNPTEAPLNAFMGGAGESQFQTLFQTEFGIPVSNSGVQNLSANQLQNFFDGNMSTLFDTPNWELSISNATSENIVAHVGQGETLDVLANANEKPVRELYKAIAAVSQIAAGNLNDAAFKKLVDTAASKVSSAMQGLVDMHSRVGLNQKSLQDTSDQLKSKKAWLNDAISKTESVDPYEVATRINGLTTQLEASYSVTSRIARISLLNYL